MSCKHAGSCYSDAMNEHEPLGQIDGQETTQESDKIESQNIRNEMAAIEEDIEAGNPLTPELLFHFQELGGRLADTEADGETARFLLAFDSAALKFKSGFIEAAIEDLQELADAAYQRGEHFDHIVEMADDRRVEYESALSRQPKP